MQHDPLADALHQLLRDHCTPREIRAIEAGASHQALWRQLEASGFADALLAESRGGAGLGLAQVFGAWTVCGAHALPVPLAQTMLVRALLALASVDWPAGPLALAEGRRDSDGSVHCAAVGLGRVADAVLVEHAEGWQLLPTAQAHAAAAAFCLDAQLHWPAGSAAAAPLLSPALPASVDARTLLACALAAQIAGALAAVFERTLQYANERQQFGRPIGKFQAIQHQLAVMSEHVFAARMAAQLGCASSGPWPDRLRVAVAKARCSQAALAVAEAGHAIHGAIGFTAEYDLQLWTRRLHAWRQAAGSESYWHGVAGTALVDAHQGATLDLLRSATDAPL